MDYRYYDSYVPSSSRNNMAYRHKEDMIRDMDWEMQHHRHNTQYPSQQYRSNDSEDGDDIRKKSFCGLVTRFAGKTSMQGIPYISAAKLWYAKFFWSLLTVAALTVSIVHMYYLISLYYEFNKKTQISLNFSSLVMPAITICHTNPVRRSQLHETPDEFEAFVRRLERDMLKVEVTARDTPKSRQKRFVSSLDNFNKSDFFQKDKFRPPSDVKKDQVLGEEAAERSIRDQFKYLYTSMPMQKRSDIGHHMRDMLISCTFKGRLCKPKDFVRSSSNTYGNCFTIQSEKYIVEESGPDDGLTIILFMESQENIDAINFGSGLRLTIHHQNATSFPAKEGFFVPPNTETNVGLRLVHIARMGQPHGTCVNPLLYEKEYGILYTRQACQSFCQQINVIDTCNCFDRLEDDIVAKMKVSGPMTTTRHCNSEKNLKCMYKVRNEYLKGEIQCSCDNPCSEQMYVRSLSAREWPTATYSKLLIESVCEKDGGRSAACKHLGEIVNDTILLPKNFVKINIYFEDLNYEKIEETQDYDDVQFYSDVGGAVGLWIGLSILSVCELLQLFVELTEFALYKCFKIDCTSHAKVNKSKPKYPPRTENKTTMYPNPHKGVSEQSRF